MLLEILRHTPLWAYAILVLLIALGLQQTRARQVPVARALLLPVAMTLLSLGSVIASFGGTWWTLLVWAAGVLAAALCIRACTRGAHAVYAPASQRFAIAGSWVPLVVMLAIFGAKYVWGTLQAVAPQAAASAVVMGSLCAVYGVLSGYFVARAWGLWRAYRAAA